MLALMLLGQLLEAPIAVDAFKLADDYSTNEVAADKRYRGKPLRVTAILFAVEKDASGRTVFRLATRNRFMHSYAGLDPEFAEKDDRIDQLTRGDKVVLLCEGRGRVSGVAVLGGCVLESAFRSAAR